MARQDRAHEPFSAPVSTLAAMAAVAAQKCRCRSRVRGRGRLYSFLRPGFFCESFPLAFFSLPDQRGPRFRLRIERELVRQRAVVGFPAKLDTEQLFINFTPSGRVVPSAKNVDPMADVGFVGRDKAD